MAEVLSPMNGYKYKSKYSMLSPEEILNEKRKRYVEWIEHLTEEQKKNLKEKIRTLNKNQNKSNICDICGGREYSDIYQHKRSKKHQKNLLISSNAKK